MVALKPIFKSRVLINIIRLELKWVALEPIFESRVFEFDLTKQIIF